MANATARRLRWLEGSAPLALFLLLALALLVSAGADDAGARTRWQKSFPPQSPERESAFGFALASDGKRLLVGAPHVAVGGKVRAGGAYLFDLATGELLHSFMNPEPGDDGLFGTKVAFVGNRTLISATGNSVGDAEKAGAVYVFDTESRTQTARLTAVKPKRAHDFGMALLSFKGKLLVGSYAKGPSGSGQGAGGIFIFDGVGGGSATLLQSPRPSMQLGFGSSLAALGNEIVAGAPYSRVLTGNAAGMVFVVDPMTKEFRLSLAAPRSRRSAYFGAAVAAAADRIYVGAPGDRAARRRSSGAVYVMSAKDGKLIHELREPDGTRAGRNFGTAIALVGNRLFVGAPPDLQESNLHEGHVYIFEADSGKLLQKLSDPVGEQKAAFGFAVTPNGADVLVGTPRAVTPSILGNVHLFGEVQ